MSGGEGSRQLVDEMKVLQEGEREELMHIFTTPTSMSAENVLALKTDLMIPWNKLRTKVCTLPG